MLASSVYRDRLCEKRPGLPCAGDSQFQPAPIDPPHDIAEPHSHNGATSGKQYLRKGKKMLDRQKRRGRKETALFCDSRIREESAP